MSVESALRSGKIIRTALVGVEDVGGEEGGEEEDDPPLVPQGLIKTLELSHPGRVLHHNGLFGFVSQ